MDYEFIDEGDIEATKRGRKSSASPKLIQALRDLPVGKAVVVKDLALDPTDPDYKSHKQTVSAQIRSAGTQAGVEVAIAFSPQGVPQVKRRKAKKSPAKK